MAIIKRGNGYRVVVSHETQSGRVRYTHTAKTKSEALAWEVDTKRDLERKKIGLAPAKLTVKELFDRYIAEVSVNKKGGDKEILRLNAFKREPWAALYIDDIKTSDLVAWRDRRLKVVKGSSVNRDCNTLSNVFQVAVKEWNWMSSSPLTAMRRPPEGAGRDRRYSPDELKNLLFCLGYVKDATPETIKARVGAALLFAIETAMRIGEICALSWEDVDLDARFLRVRGVVIGAGKSLAAKREVALSSEAIRILRQMTPTGTNGHQMGTTTIFNLTPKQQDSTFRKAKKQAGITNLTFHDSKHEAITRLAQKLLPLELAKMVGHKDLKITMTYYNPTGAELATKLD